MALAENPQPGSEKRVRQVSRWLALGIPRREIVRRCSELFKVGERQADVYIQRATGLVQALSEQDERANLNRHLSARRLLGEDAWEAGDHGVALRCFEDEAKLLGLYKSPKDQSKCDRIDPSSLAEELQRLTQQPVRAGDQPDARRSDPLQ